MAFISNEKRENLIKKINKSYGFRKFLIILEMVLLVGFIVMSFVSVSKQGTDTGWLWYKDGKLQTVGIIMLVWGAVVAVLGIIAMILTLTLKSPKSVTKQVSQLESSALSGKKIKRNDTSVSVYKERTTKKVEKKAKK